MCCKSACVCVGCGDAGRRVPLNCVCVSESVGAVGSLSTDEKDNERMKRTNRKSSFLFVQCDQWLNDWLGIEQKATGFSRARRFICIRTMWKKEGWILALQLLLSITKGITYSLRQNNQQWDPSLLLLSWRVMVILVIPCSHPSGRR